MTETIANAHAAASTLFLGHNGEWWDLGLIISVIAAALVAAAIGVTTLGSIVSHKRETAAAEDALARYKLATDKKISEANAAGDAARADAERARADAIKAQLALEQFKAPRPTTANLAEQLRRDVLPFLPKDRPPAIGAFPATVFNLQFAAWIASILGISVNQAAVETNVGPTRGVVAAYVALNERGKHFAEAFARALRDNGVVASAEPGLMQRIFEPSPQNPNFKPADPTEPGQSWVVIVVGDKP